MATATSLAIACMLLASVARAPATQQVTLRNGRTIDGVIVSSTEDRVTLSIVVDGKDGTMTLSREQLDPHSWYVVRASGTPHDAPSHLALARFCSENGLFFQAERELDRALQLDATLASVVDGELARAREGAAAKLLELAQEALAKRDPARAERLVATVITRYDDTSHLDGAHALLDRVAEARAELERQAEAERTKQLCAAAEAFRASVLAEVDRKVEGARRKNLDALRESNLSRAQDLFAGALRAYARTLKDLDRAAGERANDIDLARLIAERRGRIVAEAVDVHVSLGSTYLVRGAFTTALTHANNALALDPENHAAREFRARVEIASAESSRGRFAGRRLAR